MTRLAALLCVFGATVLLAQDRPVSHQKTDPDTAPTSAKPIDDPARAAGVPVDPKTFEIGSEDIIFIQVWRQPDFSRSHVVRPDGKITMPLIGEIQAAGLTPDVLGKNVTELLTKYINEPDVNVSLLQVNSRKYYIQGEVNRSGAFPLVVATRVLDALSSAGGFKEFANTKNIIILRKGKTLKFNYNEVTKGKKMEQNVLLENGDHIIVR
jgi:polysaccharide export outer membrane protein